jgi:hypothetical protein
MSYDEARKIEKSEYAKRQEQRRFAVFVGNDLHCETVDRDQAEHVKRLLECDGKRNVSIRVFTANQESRL